LISVPTNKRASLEEGTWMFLSQYFFIIFLKIPDILVLNTLLLFHFCFAYANSCAYLIFCFQKRKHIADKK